MGAYSWDFQSESVVAVRPSEVRQICYETEQRGSEVVERPHANGEGDTRDRPDLQVERDRGGDAVFRRRTRSRKSSNHCRVGQQTLTMHEMKRTAGTSGDSDGRERSTMEGAGQLHCYCGPI